MSEVKVDKISPKTGTSMTVGDSGDTFTVPSGATLTVAGALNVTGTTSLADGTVAVAELDIDGATDINAAIVDADLFVVDDGAGGTNRKTAASRLKTYVGASAGAFSVANLDIDGATDINAAIVDADLFVVDDGAGGTNRKTAASRLKTYVNAGNAITALNNATAGEVPYVGSTTTELECTPTLTFASNVLTVHSHVTVGGGGAEDIFLKFDGNAQDWRIGIDDSRDQFEFGWGTTPERYGAVTINNDGHLYLQGVAAGQAGFNKVRLRAENQTAINITMADDATISLSCCNIGALIQVIYGSGYQGGLFYATYGPGTITKISDESSSFAVADTDTKFCLYKSSNNDGVVFKNRLGSSRNVAVNIMELVGV